MPPKIKIKKEEIVDAALNIVRESGAGELNARSIAKYLGCSTQPIFSNYATIEALKVDVMKAADSYYQKYIEDGMKDTNYPPYKASGMYYIRFAKEEKELFKLLFMRNRSEEEIVEERDKVAALVEIISKNTGMSKEDAYLFHIEMWIYVHGIATMEATSYLAWKEELSSQMMTDAYQGLVLRFKNKSEESI